MLYILMACQEIKVGPSSSIERKGFLLLEFTSIISFFSGDRETEDMVHACHRTVHNQKRDVK